MNLIKPILGAIGILFALDDAAAQTVVRITGAQAWGNTVHRGIAHLLGASGPDPYTLPTGSTYAYTGTSINTAQKSVWTGAVDGIGPVIIKTAFNGSTAGIRVVTTGARFDYLANAVTPAATQGGTANVTATAGNLESALSDAAATNTFQGSTPYTTPTLVDRKVGVNAYTWVAGKGAPASLGTIGKPLASAAEAAADPANRYYPGLTNITTNQAQALYNVGNLPLAVFTGVATDRSSLISSSWGNDFFGGDHPVQVYATGRDYESGARVLALIEAGIGSEATLQQYKPVVGGGVVSTHALYPAATINGIFFPPGSDGNPSNNNLGTTVLAAETLAHLGGYYISYLPILDATNAVAAGAARILSWNGVAYSPEAVRDGSYSFWAYEHLQWKPSLAGTQRAVLERLAAQIEFADATILISSLKVSRPVDGGIVVNDY